jgi:MFS family permease
MSLPIRLYTLSLCQGLGITAAVVSVDIAGLAGQDLAPTAALATLPFGLQFLAMILTAVPVSASMRRLGRRPVFMAAALMGACAGALGAYATTTGSFPLLCTAHLLLGTFLAAVNLFRFAALDMVDRTDHDKAMALVLFGGVVAAILGPFIARNASTYLPLSVYASAYAALVGIGVSICLLLATLRFPAADTPTTGTPASKGGGFLGGRFLFAALCGAVGYGMMNMLMIAASLEMHRRAYAFDSISYLIEVHVFLMFFPSLFAARLLTKLGTSAYVSLGATALLAAGTCGLLDGAAGFILLLCLLGLSWNMLFLGGSSMVGECLTADQRFRGQGANDFIVNGGATLGALFGAEALSVLGWTGLSLTAIVAGIAVVGLRPLMTGSAAGRPTPATESD